MLRKAAALFALPLFLLGGKANATIHLDFEGSADGALIQNFYNGGTDSLGNQGVNYGITFGPNARIRVDHGRTYLTDFDKITLTAAFEGVSFLYSTIQYASTNSHNLDQQDVLAVLSGQSGPTDGQPLSATSAWTPQQPCYFFVGGYCTFATGFTFGNIGTSYNALGFSPAPWSQGSPLAIDSITFGNRSEQWDLPVGYSINPLSEDIPEPPPLALLGLGVFSFLLSRRIKRR